MDARGWSSRRRDRDLADPESRRTSIGGPVGRNHCCRAGDVRTGSLVDRRSALRMEAHRRTTAQKDFERAVSVRNPSCLNLPSRAGLPTARQCGHGGRAEPPTSTLVINCVATRKGRPKPSTESSQTPATSSRHSTKRLLSLRMRPNGGCGRARERPESPRTGRAIAMLAIDETRGAPFALSGRVFRRLAGTAPRARRHERCRRRVAAALSDREQDAAARCLAHGVLRSAGATRRECVDRRRARHDDVRRRGRDHR